MIEGWSIEEAFSCALSSEQKSDLQTNANNLCDLIRAGRLAVIVPEDVSHPKALSWLEDASRQPMEVTQEQLSKIRIVPPIAAPDAAHRLDGLSLVEAFRKFVLDDPEVQLLGERVGREPLGDSEVFKDGRAPGFGVAYEWDLSSTPDSLAFDFVRVPGIFPGMDHPRPSAAIKAAFTALADRFQTLKFLLVSGDIIATGTFAATGYLTPINRLDWARDGMLVHVRNGDLCEIINNKPVAKWTGIGLDISEKARLRLAVPDEVENGQSVQSRSKKAVNSGNGSHALLPPPKSTEQESIEEAIKALWPAGLPKGMPKGRRNQTINDWQRLNQKAVTHERTIARYLKAVEVMA